MFVHDILHSNSKGEYDFLFYLRYKCYLKFSWTVPRTPVIERKADVTSGFSQKTNQTQHFDKGT